MTDLTHSYARIVLAIALAVTIAFGFGFVGGVEGQEVTNDAIYTVESNSVSKFYAENGTEIWSTSVDTTTSGSPTVVNGYVYVGVGQSMVKINATTGNQIWSYNTGGYIDSSPTIIEGNIYFGARDNTLYSLYTNGTMEWQYSVGNDIRTSSPYVKNNTVYIGSQDYNLHAVNQNNGTEKWTFDTGSLVHGSPLVRDNAVYIGSANGNLYAINAENGSQIWVNNTANGRIESSPVVRDNLVYVGSWDGNMYAVNRFTGETEWSFEAHTGDNRDFDRAPTYSGDTLITGSRNGFVYALDSSTGSLQWQADVGAPVDAVPTIGNESIFIVNDNSIVSFSMDGELLWETGTPYGEASPTFVGSGSTASSGSRVNLQTLGYHENISGVEPPQSVSKNLIFDIRSHFQHNQTLSYSVRLNESGDYSDVTPEASVTSQNTTFITVDQTNHTLTSGDTNGSVIVTAEYDDMQVNETITVATVDIENLDLLPPSRMLQAVAYDRAMQVIFIAMFFSIFINKLMESRGNNSNAWVNLGASLMVILLAGLQDWVNFGIVFSAILFVIIASMIIGNVRQADIQVETIQDRKP